MKGEIRNPTQSILAIRKETQIEIKRTLQTKMKGVMRV